tara:strand:- start:757 stop:1068 length:312 start_codon:yes stop_codon:yes gene_type:complete
MGDNNYKIGDLVVVRDLCDSQTFIFRPGGFPVGKVGIIISIKSQDKFCEIPKEENIYSESYPYTYPYGNYEYDWRWYYDDLIIILIEGKKYWVFEEEIQFYKK